MVKKSENFEKSQRTKYKRTKEILVSNFGCQKLYVGFEMSDVI